ncbi:MAG: hypothetical protein ABS84_04300 [Rubrivivax sp. SCN 71-131]|nr:MAG: hypothetical protein ABS84_04300 [Rubrivivax sp. SCN 71-131]
MRDKLYRITNAARYRAVQDDAHDIIQETICRAAGGVVAIGVSGGKDSIAMLHMVAQHVHPHVIYNDSGLETPEAMPLVRGMCEKYGLPMTIAKGDAISLDLAGADTNRAIVGPVRAALQSIDAVAEFVGLRSSESKTRRIVIAKHGPIHASKRYGCLIAWPMRKWSSADVFAYIHEHALPLHPIYDRATDQERDTTRVSWVYDSAFDRWGAVEIVRRHYPQVYQRLKIAGVIQ